MIHRQPVIRSGSTRLTMNLRNRMNSFPTITKAQMNSKMLMCKLSCFMDILDGDVSLQLKHYSVLKIVFDWVCHYILDWNTRVGLCFLGLLLGFLVCPCRLFLVLLHTHICFLALIMFVPL